MGILCDVSGYPSIPLALLLFLAGCAQMGVIKSIGICLEDITEDLRTTSTDIGIALGLFSAFSFIPAPIVTVLYRKRRLRRVLMIGSSCFIAVGVMLLSVATHKVLFTVFLSISGLGTCVLMTATSVALNDIAGSHFNLMYSLGMSGLGVGMVALPFLTEFLRREYGWRGALLLLGALIGNIIPCAMAASLKTTVDEDLADVQRPHEDVVSGKPSCSMQTTDDMELNVCQSLSSDNYRIMETSKDERESDSDVEQILQKETTPLVHDDSQDKDDSNKRGGYDDSEDEDDSNKTRGRAFGMFWESLRTSDFYMDPAFNFLFFAIFLGAAIYCGWHAFLVPHALQRGVSVKDTLLITLCAAICNVTIKPLVGLLCINLFSPVSVYLLLTLLNIAALLCDSFLPNFYVMIVTSSASAGAISGRALVSTLAVLERASPAKKDIVFALDYFTHGIGNILGGYLSGMIADVFSTYDVIFKLLAGIEGVLFFVALVPWLIKKPSSA